MTIFKKYKLNIDIKNLLKFKLEKSKQTRIFNGHIKLYLRTEAMKIGTF